MGTEPADIEPQVNARKLTTPSAMIIAALIGLVGVVVTAVVTYKARTTETIPPQPPGAHVSPLPTNTSRASPSVSALAPGQALGTPLLGDQAPDGTIVAQGGDTWVDTYVNDTTESINGQKANTRSVPPVNTVTRTRM